jgi:uncharacterized protein (TIGR01777 family)
MNVLVSGSHGMIGSALSERLRRDGHRVLRLVRSSGVRPNATAAPEGPVPWDPVRGWIDLDAVSSLGPIDAVVNLAGAGIGDRRWTPARRRLIESSRILSTRLLAETMARLDPGPAVMVSASAVGIYGDRGENTLTEESTSGSGFLAEVCRRWEAATDAAEEAGVRVVHLRSGLVLAAAGGIMHRLLPLFRLGLGGRLHTGRQFVSWITLEDEVDVIITAIGDDRLRGPVNAVAPGAVTNAQFTRALGRAVGRPTLFAVPRVALEAAFGRDLADELLLASQRAVPQKLRSIDHAFTTAEIGDAMRTVVAAQR